MKPCLNLNRAFLSLLTHLTLASVVFVRGKDTAFMALTETGRGKERRNKTSRATKIFQHAILVDLILIEMGKV